MFFIDATEVLIATAFRDPQSLDVTAWASAYRLTRLDDPHRVNLIGPTSTGLNRAYAMTTDLAEPLIVAQLDVTGHPPSPLLIDGIHRLYRAWREHVPRLPAYLLTAEETRQIQDNTLLGPGRTSIAPPT
ncbi:hypothetical protein [Micromonospora sp. NPDC000018]|uniref:hypothetical protein n=1 Tax=Micromonospora sp. NPDC000018 TaxID=3154239 RepID=UPI00331AF8B3